MALTDQQRRCAVAIHEFIDEHGYSPTYEELAGRLGYAQKTTAHHFARQLIVLGIAVTRQPDTGRTLRLAPDIVVRDGEVYRLEEAQHG